MAIHTSNTPSGVHEPALPRAGLLRGAVTCSTPLLTAETVAMLDTIGPEDPEPPLLADGVPSQNGTSQNGTLAVARALHARRALEQALDHGTALLAALGLPRLVDAGFVQVDGDALGDVLEAVVAHLDAIDPDPDLEPNLGAPENHEATTVRVAPWTRGQLPPDQRRWAQGADDGREEDVADEPHGDDADAEETLGWSANVSQLALGPNTADGDHTAPERFGAGFVRCGPDDVEDDDPGGTDESGIADLDGYHEQCGFAVAGALPWSVGGYVA